MPDAFGLGQQDKAARLLARLNRLTVHHANNCPPYRQLLQAFTLSPSNTGYQSSNDYSQLPYVASGLFKAVRLLSVAEADVLRVMRSSGTGAGITDNTRPTDSCGSEPSIGDNNAVISRAGSFAYAAI